MPTLVEDGTTVDATINQRELAPSCVETVVDIVKVRSDKYVPPPSIDELEIENSLFLKDSRLRTRRRAEVIELRERNAQNPPQTAGP